MSITDAVRSQFSVRRPNPPHLKIPSTINNPTVEAQALLRLQSRNRGTKNKSKKKKESSPIRFQPNTSCTVKGKKSVACISSDDFMSAIHTWDGLKRPTAAEESRSPSKRPASMRREPREATRIEKYTRPEELTWTLPVLLVKHAE